MDVGDPYVESIFPRAPRTLEESGLTIDLVTQLLLKTLHLSGTLSGVDLASRLGVLFPVLEPSLDQLKWQAHCEIVSGSMLGGPAFKYRITDAGRTRAALFLQQNQYVGAAPVPLGQYSRYVRDVEAGIGNNATPEGVREAFSHLVLSERVLDQLGPAVRSGHSLFVYGPPGNGKTVIAQAVRKLLPGTIAIPHAIEVEGAIVRVFDPVTHEPLPTRAAEGLDAGRPPDGRWAQCRRPLVMVGGELTLPALDVRFEPTMGFYKAPVQTQANGGVLVIDDFGRQQCMPRDLLNRWIVPLESRVDFLTLQGGLKFEVPFAALVVFATNIRPAELVDEAFLRRIHYKVFAESPSVEDFIRIFENYCRQVEVPFERRVVEEVLERYFRPREIPLRGCHPRDLINHALGLAEYHGRPRHLTTDLLETVCESYFVEDRDPPTVDM
jgi:predicted ATPase with chaperone activity